MRLMEDAVRRVREGDRHVHHPRPEVTMSASAYLPDDYIRDRHQKLHLYRRLAKVSGARDVEALSDEITDRFGRPPSAVRRLLDQSLLGLAGRSAGADRILVRGDRARVNFRPEVVPRISALEGTLKGEAVRLEVRRIAPLSVTFACEDADRLAPVLIRALETLGGGTNGGK